jgi:hypothetical protein
MMALRQGSPTEAGRPGLTLGSEFGVSPQPFVVYRSRYEPEDRRFGGGIRRQHRRTPGVAGQWEMYGEMGVVRRLRGPARAATKTFVT